MANQTTLKHNDLLHQVFHFTQSAIEMQLKKDKLSSKQPKYRLLNARILIICNSQDCNVALIFSLFYYGAPGTNSLKHYEDCNWLNYKLHPTGKKGT